MKKLFCCALATCAVACSWADSAPKYVFLFIGDGMSVPQRMVAEEFALRNGLGEFAMNRFPHQTNTRTKSANAIITDSAAAATAIACGTKTKNGSLGVDANGKRLESVAEAAKKAGRKVGIMTSVTICHATPGGFYAHRPSRGMYYAIALDLIASDFDYFAGGGIYNVYNETKNPAYKGDIRELAKKAGYQFSRNDRAAWEALKPGSKSWSVFGEDGMSYAIDNDASQPKLADLVAKAIEVLDNDKGFFIMCEGGKVDYAGHANDAATNVHEMLALNKAVQVALEFQKKHPADTLIITTGDHETGGMTMGFAGCGGAFKVELLSAQKVSTEAFSEKVKKLITSRKGEITFEEIQPLVTENFGLTFHADGKNDQLLVNSAAELKTLKDAFETDVSFVRARVQDTKAHDVARRYVFAQAVKNVLNAHAGVGWSSGDHTALPTLTTAIGAKAEIVHGMTENTDIGGRLKALYRE